MNQSAQAGLLKKPKYYKDNFDSFSVNDTIGVPPYFPYNHPNTKWLVHRILNDDATSLMNVLKMREGMSHVFKHMYFQLLDNPADYSQSQSQERPMFNSRCSLFLTLFGVAVYFKARDIVQTLGPVRVAKLDGSGQYLAISESSVQQFASHLHDKAMGDLFVFDIPMIMMRREFFFAASVLLRSGCWQPTNRFYTNYYKMYYRTQRMYDDWLEYCWSLLLERPHTRIAQLISIMSNVGHRGFYIGEKVFYEPIACRYYSQPISVGSEPNVLIVYRSYARRLLCKLFMLRNPIRVLPQVLAVVQVFYDQRYFTAQSRRAQDPEFLMNTRSSLEERLLTIAPICDSDNVNPMIYKEEFHHHLTLYDYDNVVALLLYFMSCAAERKAASIQQSMVKMIIDILVDTGLLYIMSKEPAVNISYYMSYLVDGPFVQPRDLSCLLRTIPIYLLNRPFLFYLFPPILRTSDSRLDRQQTAGYQLFTRTLKKLWEEHRHEEIVRTMLAYRMQLDDEIGIEVLEHCAWKNEFLSERLAFSLKTIRHAQYCKLTNRVPQQFVIDDEGACHISRGWKGSPKSFFDKLKHRILERVKTVGLKFDDEQVDRMTLWTPELLGIHEGADQ